MATLIEDGVVDLMPDLPAGCTVMPLSMNPDPFTGYMVLRIQVRFPPRAVNHNRTDPHR
jgi:hypothetical protein